MRDADAIQCGHIDRTLQPSGVIAFFSGNTTVLARERHFGGISLEPIGGDYVACGEWVDLSLDDNTAESSFREIIVWGDDDLQEAYENAVDMPNCDEMPEGRKSCWWKNNGAGFHENLSAYGNEILSEIDWDTI